MKKHVSRIIIALAFCVSVAPGAQSGQVLGSKALRALFPGTFQGTAHGLFDVWLAASSNGTLYGTIMGRRDRGHWKISRGQLCISLANLTDGKYKCSYVHTDGKSLIAHHDGPIVLRKLDGNS